MPGRVACVPRTCTTFSPRCSSEIARGRLGLREEDPFYATGALRSHDLAARGRLPLRSGSHRGLLALRGAIGDALPSECLRFGQVGDRSRAGRSQKSKTAPGLVSSETCSSSSASGTNAICSQATFDGNRRAAAGSPSAGSPLAPRARARARAAPCACAMRISIARSASLFAKLGWSE